ncbi:MAG TPA: hypothetical protein PKW55_00590 [Spirochaetota bacterium]|nr:hypothetical protein [Spirochaetota bacterium]HOM39268.1 hypothetical protein [Spirochaetota bacterium]HPQ49269.1 hypothetical protein [Spirochaetota bacterium]
MRLRFLSKIFVFIIPVFIVYSQDYKIIDKTDKKYRILINNLEITVLNYSANSIEDEIENIDKLIKALKITGKEYLFLLLPDRIQFNLKGVDDLEYKGKKIGKMLPNGIALYFDRKEKKIYYNFNGIDTDDKLVKVNGDFENTDKMLDEVLFLVFPPENKYEIKVRKEEKRKLSGFFNPNILYISMGSGHLFSFPVSILGYGFGSTFLEFAPEIGYIEGTKNVESPYYPGVYDESTIAAGTIGFKINYIFLNYTDMTTYFTLKPYYAISFANYDNRLSGFIGIGQRLVDIIFVEFGLGLSNNKESLVIGFGLLFHLDRQY